jgi:hypothetical protein
VATLRSQERNHFYTSVNVAVSISEDQDERIARRSDETYAQHFAPETCKKEAVLEKWSIM